VHQTGDPEVVVAELELRGTVRGTGRPFAFPSVGVIRVRDGRIVAYRDYYNPRAVPEALAASGGS
jgi:ketosteroid isomerase-like protein